MLKALREIFKKKKTEKNQEKEREMKEEKESSV